MSIFFTKIDSFYVTDFIMIKYYQFLLAFIFFGVIHAQQKITVEDIYKGAFRAKGMDELAAMPTSNQYTILQESGGQQQIDLYDFATRKKVATLFDLKNFPQLTAIDSYTISSDEKSILIASNSTPIYRHSFMAEFHLFDLTSGKLTRITDQKIQEPAISPDGKHVAYVFNNNLFLFDIHSGAIRQLTSDGKKNNIINGITDWVYEEEFSFVRAFDWNSIGTKLAFIKFDETEVPEFSMDLYGDGLYPLRQEFKYPKAGEKNSKVSLHIVDVSTGIINNVNLDEYQDFYIPRLKWTKDGNILSTQISNRLQNNLDLLLIDGSTAKTIKVALFESDAAYVDITDNLTFLTDGSFIWTSEKDGYNHIYHYSKDGKIKNQITRGKWDVTDFYGVDEKTKTVFYQSVERGSIHRDVFKINLNGKNKIRLTSEPGTSKAIFSPTFSHFIHSFSSSSSAPRYTLNESKSGKVVQTIVENSALEQKLSSFALPEKEFMVITTDKGIELNAWMIKPKDFDPAKKYPLFMYQYSGPGSQEVANEWNSYNDYWFFMLSQQGYIVACVDGRGTGFKGAAFKKVTQKQLGKYEVQDQIDAARLFSTYSYIDKSRIGIYGWSYGGFMSSNCILQGNDIFKMAIAVAPVTSWRYYDSIYTERFMTTPQENPSGYDENSPISHVRKLKGKYLLIHGTADDNVHVQNSMNMINALVHANKQFDWAIYPDKNHGIYGGATRIQLFNKMTDFIKTNL